jgi:hypothetical protein
MKEVVEEFKMGLDAQKSFAQMYKDGNMNKRVWGEMMKLDPVVIQESKKEIRERNSQSSLKIRKNSNNLARIFIRMAVA